MKDIYTKKTTPPSRLPYFLRITFIASRIPLSVTIRLYPSFLKCDTAILTESGFASWVQKILSCPTLSDKISFFKLISCLIMFLLLIYMQIQLFNLYMQISFSYLIKNFSHYRSVLFLTDKYIVPLFWCQCVPSFGQQKPNQPQIGKGLWQRNVLRCVKIQTPTSPLLVQHHL